MDDLKKYIEKEEQGEKIKMGDEKEDLEIMMQGKEKKQKIGGLIMEMRVRGEKVKEIEGEVD